MESVKIVSNTKELEKKTKKKDTKLMENEEIKIKGKEKRNFPFVHFIFN